MTAHFRRYCKVHQWMLFIILHQLTSSCIPAVAPVSPPEIYKGPVAERPTIEKGDYWLYQRGALQTKTAALPTNIGFPLWIGKTWNYDTEMIRVGAPASTSHRNEARVSCQATTFTQITVTAGTFDTFQCDCECIHTAQLYEPGCGTWKFWYAPAVKNVVRMATGSTETSFELVQYKTRNLPAGKTGPEKKPKGPESEPDR